MSKTVKCEYTSKKSNKVEKVYNEDGRYFIDSGYFGKTEISRGEMESCLRFSGAPEHVVKEIIKDN